MLNVVEMEKRCELAPISSPSVDTLDLVVEVGVIGMGLGDAAIGIPPPRFIKKYDLTMWLLFVCNNSLYLF